MKKFYLFVLLVSGISMNCISQNVTNYSFAASAGSFTTLSGATVPPGTGTVDEGIWNAIPIGFNFWYMGTRYTTVSASTNGWLTLGANITDPIYTNSLSSGGAPRPVLAPLWDDLNIQSGNNATYLTSGTAGSRIFTLQFLNYKWNFQATGNTMSFQVKFYEGTGKIEYIYRPETGALNAASASIGITATAAGSGNFLSVNNLGNGVSSTAEASITAKPASGRVYAFAPPIPVVPASLIFSSVNNISMTLNWSDLSSNERGFLIYQSTDNVTYTFATQTAANATTSIQTGLSPATLYYWKIYAVSEGGFSTTALSGSKITSCSAPAAPVVNSPVNYCQNATASVLTATGTNLLWGGAAGSAGGTSALATTTYVDNSFSNKKLNFTTTIANTTLTTVDFYITSYQAVSGLVLSLYNSIGTIIATSSTTTNLTAGAASVKISNSFNYNMVAAGDYSIGISAGSGNIGSDNPIFPVTEPTGTINITGGSMSGIRCFNNIQFTTTSISTAPTPSTINTGAFIYLVSQTVGGCVSSQSTITVNVSSPNLSQLPASNLEANYKFSGNANDATGINNGTLQNAPTLAPDRFNVSNRAYTFNGSTQYISTALAYSNPLAFSISVWFKTNTVTGGRLIGFGNAQTGQSGNYDRHLYMTNSGQVYFGVYPNSVVTINSPLSYNDNNWHLATATLSSTAGMALYIDGALVSSNPANTTAQNYTGYWRIGYDHNNNWTSQPSSFYFSGILDDALIYTRALTAAEVTTLYKSPDGAGNDGPTCTGSPVNLSATTISGASYSWSGPNGFSAAVQNPTFSYAAANAGIYTMIATAAGCTATAYTTLVSSSNTGQWTGSVNTDWANAGNWCNGAAPGATTNVVIAAGATNMPSIISSVSCNSLTINAGATVTISNAGTLNIAGTLTNNGTFTDNGTTNFNGTTGQQSFTGVTTFNNLTVNNAIGLILSVATIVKNNLTISAGILNINAYNITIAGNWINNASTVAFTPGTRSVTFNGTSAKSIGGSFATTFYDLIIANTGSTLSLGVNANIVNSLLVSAGTFDLGSFSANRVTSGGSLTISNNTTLKIGGTNTFPLNYTINSLAVAGTVEYAGTNQTISNQTYGNLTVSSASGAAVKTFPATSLTVVGNLNSILGAGTSVSLTAAADITVSGNVSIGASTTFNGGNFSHSIGGNWVNAGVFTGSTSTITFIGAGKSVSGTGAQNFNNLTVAASLVSFSNDAITLSGNLTTTGAGSFNQAPGGTLTMSGSGKTITGTGISLDNLSVSGTVSTAASLTLTGNLSVSGSFTASAGSVTMSGTTKSISGAGSKIFATLSVTGTLTTSVDFSVSIGLIVNGTLTASAGTATFTGTSTLSGTANLFNTTVNGTSLQLSTNSILGIANALTITAGTLNVTSSAPNTVQFNGTGPQNINAITYSNLVVSNGNTKTATGNITTTYDITIGTGTTFNAASYTIIIFGSWINQGIFTAGTGTVQFEGPATAYVTGATTFNILTSNTSSSTTPLILNSNVSASVVNMINGIILTGTNTINITNTRTGNGHIYGNIQRTHTFTTGVAYAFEGPDNSITFSTVAGVNSITVSVVQTPISDFPFGGSISRLYTVTIPAGTYNATLRLHYEDGELNGNNESSMGLWQYNGSVWGSIGKTANNTTSNYVEQGGLTNITGRWTCSDNQNVVQWNGSVSTDWNTAANWTTLQGSGSMPPTASDIVNLGTAAFTNQPTISTTVNVKNIVFGSVQAVVLSMSAGGTLGSGDIKGNWSTNTNHTINANNQTININGDLELSDGVTGHAINVNIGTGTINIFDELTQRGGANIVFSGAGNLNIGGDYHYSNGTFTPATGTVTYNGAISQVIGAVGYNHLTINKSLGLATIGNVINVGGNLTITAGQLDNASTTTILGNVLISPGSSFQNIGILHVGGNWTNNGTYTAKGASIFFDGSGTQNISASTFNNFNINKPVGSSAVLTGNVIVNGDLILTSGTLDIQIFDCNRSVQGGTATLAGAGTLIIGANNPPINFSGYSLANTSTVIFNGTSAQTLYLPGVSLGHLILRNAGTKTLTSPVTVNGNLTIESGAGLDAGANTITLTGNWINSGTFIPSTGTVLFSSPVIKTISGITTFNNVTVSGIDSILNNISINGLLNITNTGNFRASGAIHVTMNGDLLNSGILYNLGTTTFTGNVLQTLSLINAVQTVALFVNFNGSVSPVLNSTSPPQYGFLTINNTGGVSPSVGWTILYNLTVGAGATFNGGISTHDIYGSFTNNGTVTSSGTLNFTPANPATINLGSNFSSTGRVVFAGAGAITLLGTPVSLYRVLISNTNVAGITPSSNWNIANNFFVNSGSKLNAGTYNYFVGGNISNNGTINSGTSTFTMNGAVAQDIYTVSAFNNLTINNSSAGVILSSNATVNGALNFVAGKIQTGSNSLILPASGTVTGAAQGTGWIHGNLQKYIASGATSKTFETGDAVSFAPLALAFTNVTTAGDLTVITTTGDHPNINTSIINPLKTVNRFWTLTNSGIGYNNYNATFYFVPADIDGGATTAAFGVGLYNGSSWVMPVVSFPNATNIQANGITATGSFSIGEVCNAGTTISYPSTPYCSNAGSAGVMLTGSGGGVFTSTPGLSINSTTGTVNLSASTIGAYSITYTIAAGAGCPAFITSANIVITAAPSATISYAGSHYCSSAGSAAVTQIGTPGGVYSSTAIPGLVIDSLTGTIDLAASYDTTYTVTYTIAGAGGCSTFSTSTIITITTQPFASGTYDGNPYCSNGGIAYPTGTFAGIAGTLTSTPGLVIDPSNGVVNLASSTPGNYTVTYSVPAIGGCAAYSNTAVISIVMPGTWTGAVSSNWADGGNWLCGAIPVSNTDVTISGNSSLFPILTGTGSVNNIIIDSGAIFTITGGALSIGGVISNSGTLEVSAGTIEMNGSSPQTIPANAFANNTIFNLLINNNVTLEGLTTLTGTLTIGSSGKTFATGDLLVLNSTALSTAMVARVPVDGTGAATSFFPGNVTVERYIPNKRAWRLLTSPLSATGPIFNGWQNAGVYEAGKGMLITGPNAGSTNGLDISPRGNISLKSFNPVTQSFLNITNTKTSNLSNSTGSSDNIGYFAFVRGDRNLNNLNAGYSSATTLKSSGKLQTGKQIFAASTSYNSYTIIGNPYASPVDFNDVQLNHLMKRFYAWDATINVLGAYVMLDDIDGDGTFSSTDYSSLQNKYIQSGQAFFVQTNANDAASIIFNESNKSVLRSNAVFRPQQQIRSMSITLYLAEAGNPSLKADAVLAEFNENFSAGVNLQDAIKFTNINETLSFLRDGISLALERRPVINSNDTLFLKLVQATPRNYQFVIQPTNLDQPLLVAFLEDNYLATNTPLSLTGKTIVNFTINSDAASAKPERFRVVFKQISTLPVTYRDVKASQQGNNIAVQWEVHNQLNIQSYDVEKSVDGIHFTRVATQAATGNNGTAATYHWLDIHAAAGDNFYRIRNIDLDGSTAYSKVVKVNKRSGPAEITVYPNPSTDGNIGLQMNNMPAGKYLVRLSNPLGQEILSKEINHPGGTMRQKIQPEKQIARGLYNLEITHPDNTKTNIGVVNQ